MFRYRMTLREYVLTMKRNYWTARVMFGQLLEAIVFLYEHTISHRDMKSDNILLDFNYPGLLFCFIRRATVNRLTTGSRSYSAVIALYCGSTSSEPLASVANHVDEAFYTQR